MNRKKIPTGPDDVAKAHTFYDTSKHVVLIDQVATALGKNRSEFIRWCVDPHIEQLRTGEIRRPDFKIEDKQAELLKACKKEKEWEEILKKLPSRKNTAYSLFKELAGQLGSDADLKKDFAEVVEKMKTTNMVDASMRVKFVLYGQAVLNRRVIEDEIDAYLTGTDKQEGAASNPLVEKALVA